MLRKTGLFVLVITLLPCLLIACSDSNLKGVLGESCQSGNDCQSTFCSQQFCKEKPSLKKAGEPCQKSADCKSNHCVSNVDKKGASCTNSRQAKENGESCQSNNECKSQLCSQSQCKKSSNPPPTKKKIGETCQSHSDCESNYCNQNQCQKSSNPPPTKKKIGETCHSDSDCESSYCDQNRCAQKQNPPTKKKLGESCQSNNDCESSYCDQNRCAQKQTPPAKKKLGESCQSNNDCESNHCDQNRCAQKQNPPTKKKLGEACQSNNDCEKNNCLNDGKETYCTATCTTSCPTNYTCVKLQSGAQACAKTANLPKQTQALPKTAFVYTKNIRKGNSFIVHFYGYDIATKKHWLITKLDDKTQYAKPALSPDRKWLVFSAFFRPTQVDLNAGILIRIIWAVSVDGKHFRRLSQPIPNPNKTKCTSTTDCQARYGKEYECTVAGRRCSPLNYSMGVSEPRWSHDGQFIWFTFGQFWSQANGKLIGGTDLASVQVATGKVNLLSTKPISSLSKTPAPSPDGKFIVIHKSISITEGFYISSLPLGQPAKLLFPKLGGDYFGQIHPTWFPDSSGFIFSANGQWDTDGDGKIDLKGAPLMTYGLKKNQVSLLLKPYNNHTFRAVAISPDQNYLALCLETSKSQNIAIYDARAKKVIMITTDGASCNPTW